MAGRVNIYQLIRKVHMYSAFITMTFLVMYFVTGYLMNNWQWFDEEKPTPVTTTTPLSIPQADNLHTQAASLKDTLNIRGRFVNSWTNRGTTYYEYQSMQRQTIVFFDSTKTAATVKESDKNTLGAVTAYHRMHKYGGPLAYNAYILMMDLASAALLLFALTGIYMWLGFAKYRWLGITFLTAGIIYTAWVWLSFILY